MKNLSPEDYIADPSRFVIVDVRSLDEWDSLHEEGALHIPLPDLADAAQAGLLPKGKPLAVVCRTGGRSARACEGLEALGYDARNLMGGLRLLALTRAQKGLISSVHAHEMLKRL